MGKYLKLKGRTMRATTGWAFVCLTAISTTAYEPKDATPIEVLAPHGISTNIASPHRQAARGHPAASLVKKNQMNTREVVKDELTQKVDLSPEMSAAEKGLFTQETKGSENYFEWGCGGSTTMMIEDTEAEVTSVESSKEWISKVKGDISAGEQARLHMKWVDIGRTREWGNPANSTRRSDWPNYSAAICKESTKPDTVLVDGRFRVACALKAALCAPAAKLLIHDFTNRPEYQKPVLEVYDMVSSAQRMAVFKRKNDVSDADIEEAYKGYRYTTA